MSFNLLSFKFFATLPYRTPEAIARYLLLRPYASTRLLDPCAGS